LTRGSNLDNEGVKNYNNINSLECLKQTEQMSRLKELTKIMDKDKPIIPDTTRSSLFLQVRPLITIRCP